MAQFLQTLNTDCFVKTPHIKGLKTTLSLFKLNPPPKIIHTAVLCLCLIEHQRNARVVKTSNRVLMAIYFLNDLLKFSVLLILIFIIRLPSVTLRSSFVLVSPTELFFQRSLNRRNMSEANWQPGCYILMSGVPAGERSVQNDDI